MTSIAHLVEFSSLGKFTKKGRMNKGTHKSEESEDISLEHSKTRLNGDLGQKFVSQRRFHGSTGANVESSRYNRFRCPSNDSKQAQRNRRFLTCESKKWSDGGQQSKEGSACTQRPEKIISPTER
jgi:hypothetical protein